MSTIESTRLFYELTPEKILSAVESYGLECTGRCLALNSMENRVYEVEIEIEPELVHSPRDKFRIVKFYRPGRWSAEQIGEEHTFLKDLVDADIPVIAPLQSANGGGTLHEVDGTGIYFTVFPKGGGRQPDELNDDQLLWLGRLLARMHIVGAQREAPHRLELNPTTYGTENLAFLLESGLVPEDLALRLRDAVEGLVREVAPLFEGIAIQRIHGDCHFGNILWGSEGPFFVDFDDMVRGPCVQDFWLAVLGRDSEALIQRELLLEGYEQLRHFDRRELKLIEPLRALRMVHYTAWVGKRWSDPAFQRVFTNFGTRAYWEDDIRCIEDQRSVIAL